MADAYVSLTVDLPEGDAELLQDLFHERGAQGLEVRDREAPPMPGVRGPKSGEAIVIAYFDDRALAEEVLAELRESFPAARASLEAIENRDWSNEWKSRIRSTTVGRLWVGPPWETPPSDKITLTIEPKMAFGTGDHPTTALCLGAVDDFLAKHPGASVLDVGTGTAVLAIAAKKLGAGRVVGVDNDPMSVELARENAQLNGTPELELSLKSLDAIDGRFDLVLANILANTLIELAPAISAHVEKRLVLAGILAPQADSVAEAYQAQGLRRVGQAQIDNWVRLDLER
jgi:ribosomal protein L11 methyltransferase